MISDVLFEAHCDIEEYEREIPTAYSGLRDELAAVKAVIKATQLFLDAPPVVSTSALREQIAAAVQPLLAKGGA